MHNNLLIHNGMHINFVFRFNHSLINPTFTRLDKDNNPLSIGPLNLTESFLILYNISLMVELIPYCMACYRTSQEKLMNLLLKF